MTLSVPNFDDLPPVEGQPKGFAWGIFDKDGKKDVLGTLNFLTPDVVKAAATEVKDGISVSLNWPLNGLKFPLPNRNLTSHTAHQLTPGNMGVDGWDDELTFNTQISSQWDSLCHFVHGTTDSEPGTTYNGFRPTKETLEVAFSHESPNPTIDHWHARGGVVGRGVLIDYKRWVEETTGVKYHTLDGHRITIAEIEEVAKYQNVEFKEGDILIVRTGYTDMLAAPTPEDFGKFQAQTLSGVHGVEETVRWVWNKRISAVAGDAHAFEALPPVKADGNVGTVADLYLHRWFLNGLGMPIGELWDLNALGEQCKKLGRYSFLLTSAPLNHPGLVASPPNALAIF
ncbi:putative cyclase-domain-containing protein [Immersiella caudata]|uniref:Cyclase-domain-containing protein n=1 Tax=Immersiella caudata TaxID=314043 RepID=A0AA39WQ47_9PEZI|nr:putative cyclase-domain-containing protein [Immersiella caudata]